MQISNNFSVSSVDALRGAAKSAPASDIASEPSTGTITPVDQLELSAEAQGVSGVEANAGDIRVDRVADIRRQIAEGSYDTEEKLSAALDNFLDQIG